jgi:hypothetical protein
MIDQKPTKASKSIIRYLMIFLGVLFVALGIIGIAMPILPTTPFFLLAAYFFVRSSQRLYRWLLMHRIFGNYIRNYIHHKAISPGIKIFTLILLWATILTSIYLMKGIIWVQIILVLVAIGVSIHILSLRTMHEK